MPRRSCRLSAFVRSSPLSNRVRSFVLIAFVLLTALSLPPRVRGTSYSDVFPAALSNYAFGGWQGPFGDGTAGRLFPTSDGTGIYADATYNGLVWILRSSPEFSSIDMTMHFSIPNRDFTDADYFALLLILHSPTTPSSTPPGTNCDGTCSYVAGQSGFKLLYRIGFNQLVITNGPGNVTLSQVSLPPVALNQPHDARATYAAGNLTVYLDSVQLATLQIPNVPPGQIGFETYRTDLIVNTITLVGSPVPGFALSVNPASATIVSGSSTNATMIVASVSGFSGTVALSATTLTSSLTASLNPSSLVLAPGSILTSTLTVNASSFCGNQTVTVTGTSGSATGSVTFTVTGHCTFDFSLADSPATLTIVQGGPSGVETATATLLTGLTSSIAFSVTTPLPTGVTASVFTPASCSPTCSPTVTLTASITAPGSTTTLAIQAAGSGVTRTAAFSLVVVPPGTFDFSVAVRPSTLSIIHGEASGLEIVSTTLLVGATTPVTFSIATALPTGVTAYPFAPTSCSPSCSTSVTLTASATAPPSTTALTIQAVGGGVTRTATFNLVVTCNTGGSIDFCLAASPSTLTIVPGGPSGVETVSATLLGGTTTPVTFNNLTVLPTGVTASVFTPASCSPTCSATWTFTASPSAPASTRILYISATGGGVTSPANFTLVVQQCTCQISLAPSPSTLTIIPGGAGETETVSATLVAGVAPSVTFSITSPLPTGVGASAFTPVSCIPTCSATVMLTASSTAPGSNTTMTIQATGGGITRTTTFNLVVTCGTGGAFDVCLATTPPTLTIFPGGPGGVETVATTLLAGSTTPMTFSIPNPLPPGVTASAFTPVSCNPTCSATVSLTASSTAPFDTSTVVTISATGGGLTRTATFTLFVVQGISADYSLSVAPTSVTLVPGTTSAASIVSALALVAGVQPVTLSISGLPTGVTASAFTPNPITPASPAATSMFSLTDAATAPVVAGVTITITGTSVGGLVRTTTFTLNVVASFDYSLSVAPTTVSLAPGTTSAPSTVSALLVATGAGVQTVTLSLSGLPTGVTASAFTPNPVTPASPAATS